MYTTTNSLAAIYHPPAIRVGAASLSVLLALGAVRHLPQCAPFGLKLYACDARFTGLRHHDHTEQSSEGSTGQWPKVAEIVAVSSSTTAVFSLAALRLESGQLYFTPPSS